MKKLISYVRELLDYVMRLECCTNTHLVPRPNVLNILREINKMEENLNGKKD